ncbi:MAG: outer membrane protein assembly factor BamE [Rhizomicrobium sp.]
MKFLAGLFLGASALLIACAPTIDQRGYLPDPQLESGIKPGTDTKTTVQDRLGNASITASFGNDAWYYVSSTEKQVAFFKPTVLSRQILAIYFDKGGKVMSLRHFSLKNGHVISFETRQTATRGRELTFLQQLLNAQPGTSQGNMEETNPGSGGGPPTGGGLP